MCEWLFIEWVLENPVPWTMESNLSVRFLTCCEWSNWQRMDVHLSVDQHIVRPNWFSLSFELGEVCPSLALLLRWLLSWTASSLSTRPFNSDCRGLQGWCELSSTLEHLEDCMQSPWSCMAHQCSSTCWKFTKGHGMLQRGGTPFQRWRRVQGLNVQPTGCDWSSVCCSSQKQSGYIMCLFRCKRNPLFCMSLSSLGPCKCATDLHGSSNQSSIDLTKQVVISSN